MGQSDADFANIFEARQAFERHEPKTQAIGFDDAPAVGLKQSMAGRRRRARPTSTPA
ncbi:MAG: hypothetical protein NVS3B5_05780 [Sphingomicrobium sp.]